MFDSTYRKRQKGITLIEIWLIIGIIGALAMVVLSFSPY